MKYYIQNTNAGFLGNSIYFWGQDGSSYTAKLEKAKKFTHKEAKDICEVDPKKYKAWPVEYIVNNDGTATVTDSQYLNREMIVDFKF